MKRFIPLYSKKIINPNTGHEMLYSSVHEQKLNTDPLTWDLKGIRITEKERC